MTDFFDDAPTEAIKADRPLTADEIREANAKANRLAYLGYFSRVERYIDSVIDATPLVESDLKTLRDIYAQAEREAALRGDKWEVIL
jgi:hypothetical protein